MTRRSRRGLTLLELIIVIVIFSILLGFSAMFFRNANRDLGVTASANRLTGLLRAAQQQARGSAAPAWVVLNTQRNAAWLVSKETIGEWHLEDASGAFGKPAQVTSGTAVPGRVGRALQLSGSGSIRCGDVPLLQPDQGVAVELWYLRKGGRSRGILATIGDFAEIAVEADGRIGARLGGVAVGSGQLRLPTDVWCHVQLIYSGRDLRLVLNRNPVDVKAARLSWPGPLPFTVGASGSGVTGIVDEIRLSLLLPREEHPLAGEAAFELAPGTAVPPDGDVVIAFDAEGRLESASRVQFWIRSSTLRQRITVHPGGSVEQQEDPPEPPPAAPATPARN
jgi:prepilin-type N-terminal cleavage/methylation domain-containing protein